MEKIPLTDLKKQYLDLKKEIDRAIAGVIANSLFIMGESVRDFEKKFAKFLKVKDVISVSSGTSALFLVLNALGVGAGDEVITSVFTFTATAEAIVNCGARPVFADINPDTYNIDISQIKSKISKRTKAIIPVHLYGQPADMNELNDLINSLGRKIYIIEDCAQAHGAAIKMSQYHNKTMEKWKKVGSIGDAGCFSFYPAKNLGAYGDAGAISASDGKLAEKIRLLRDHGRTEKYLHRIVGFNERADSLQMAILEVKLKYLEKWNKKRQENAALYNSLLSGLPISIPFVSERSTHVYHQYVVRSKKRDLLRQFLADKGVSTGVHYPIPLHLQPAYRFLDYKRGDFQVAEKAAEEVISLPVYPELTARQIYYIAGCIKDFYS